MTKEYTEQIFRTSYKDDFADSDNYHRILFNSGRALQARELTQLQTIIQKEISRLGSNLFKDGAPIQPGGVKINSEYEFIKLAGTGTAFPSDLTTLQGIVLTGQSSGIKVRILEAVAATASDPKTIYVQYLDDTSGATSTSAKRVTPGETISDGGDFDFVVQTENTASNPAFGQGCQFNSADGSFFVQGHFVFAPNQKIIISKYDNKPTTTIGFKVVQDIVTSSDDDALFDNQGVTPNRSSPGADRYRIRLILTDRKTLTSDDNFVAISDVVAGEIATRPSATDGFNSIRDEMAVRTFEESGNYIKKYFKANLEPNDNDSFKLRVSPGTAYVNGYRINKEKITTLYVPRATDTFTQDNEAISIDYGNYIEFDSAAGMLNFDTCELVNLNTASQYAGTNFGTARVRAIKEGTGNKYNLYLFDLQLDSAGGPSIRDIKSIGTSSSNHVSIALNASGNSEIKEPNKRALIFDTPIIRPKAFTSISLTGARRFSETTSPSGVASPALSASNENFENTGDWIVTTDSAIESPSISLNSGATTATISGLAPNQSIEVLAYVKKGTGKIRQKNLTETTVTTTIDSDGNGFRYLPLGKSDIYEVTRIRITDSDGDNVFSNFALDPGQRDTHYGDGRLLPKTNRVFTGQNIFVRFKYFDHGTGDFFAVNSYTGQVEYRDIPAYRLANGSLISLRDVIDFRPSTDGSGNFPANRVSELPQPTDLVEADAEYFLPRLDKLVLSQTGELKYITGTPSLQPKYPQSPKNSIDLYKFELKPNTLHTKDISSTIIPLKGYTMADIGKIEEKLNKVEELATLTLLELATSQLKSLDSDGVDRAKSGYFVDNFADQRLSDTKSPEYRAAIDPRNKFVRPTFKEQAIDLKYDSSHTDQLRVVKYGDLIMLDHTEVLHTHQDIASKTENVNPFFVERITGFIKLSPSSDYWKESEKAAPRLVDGGTKLDTRQALLWNNWEWNWNGVDVNDLKVGDASSNVTGVNTTVTQNTSDPRLIGTNVNEEVGDWVVTGTSSKTTDLGSQEVLVSTDTEEVIRSREVQDIQWGTDGARDGYGAGDWQPNSTRTETWTEYQTTNTYETRTATETVNTSTLEQTTTITTENQYAVDTEVVTNTSTTTTVNRIAAESTIREVIDNRIIDIALIPWMRSRIVSFKATGLRPNTRFFPFFDGSAVSNFCRETDFQNFSDVDDGSTARIQLYRPTIEHPDGTTSLVSDANGEIAGEFYIPNNSAMRFRTGRREFALYDISVYNEDDALCTATAFYTAEGTLETRQDTVLSTRILEVVGSQTTVDRSDVKVSTSISTDTLITTAVATDVLTEKTFGEKVSDTETTSAISKTDPTLNVQRPNPVEVTPDVSPDDEAIRSNLPGSGSGIITNPNLFEYDANGVPIDFVTYPIVDTVKNNICRYFDPLAQTFTVDDPNGIFVTRVRVYFASKPNTGAGDANLPVRVELRPVVNGVPSSSKVIPGSTVVKNPSAVNTVPADPSINTMLANGTDFVFEEPVYLANAEYALVIRSDSNDYKVYISEVEDFLLGSTEQRISKQPYLGSLFKSQNSTLWEPAQRQDLAFRLYRAQFEYSGNVILENTKVPFAGLTKDPFFMDSGDTEVTVLNRGHGLRTGDTVNINVDSSTATNDFWTDGYGSSIPVKLASLRGNRTITGVDGSGYRFAADSAAQFGARFGGSRVTATRNIPFETARLMIQNLQPETTNITFSGKFTSHSSLADSASGRYNKDTSYQLLKNYNNYEFPNPKAIYNSVDEVAELENSGLGKSATIQCTLTTTDRRVSPVIDMQRAGMALIGNMIDYQDVNADSAGVQGSSGFSPPMRFFPETDPLLGSSLSKHCTIPIELSEEAVGLKILLAANKPPNTDFQVYYRTADAGENIRKNVWVNISPENTLPSDTNRNVFREYRYLVGGLNGTLDAFTQFQIKIVFRSKNSAKVPVIRDLRAIALSV